MEFVCDGDSDLDRDLEKTRNTELGGRISSGVDSNSVAAVIIVCLCASGRCGHKYLCAADIWSDLPDAALYGSVSFIWFAGRFADASIM